MGGCAVWQTWYGLDMWGWMNKFTDSVYYDKDLVFFAGKHHDRFNLSIDKKNKIWQWSSSASSQA